MAHTVFLLHKSVPDTVNEDHSNWHPHYLGSGKLKKSSENLEYVTKQELQSEVVFDFQASCSAYIRMALVSVSAKPGCCPMNRKQVWQILS